MNGYLEVLKFVGRWAFLLPVLKASGKFAVGLVHYIQNSKEIDEIYQHLHNRK